MVHIAVRWFYTVRIQWTFSSKKVCPFYRMNILRVHFWEYAFQSTCRQECTVSYHVCCRAAVKCAEMPRTITTIMAPFVAIPAGVTINIRKNCILFPDYHYTKWKKGLLVKIPCLFIHIFVGHSFVDPLVLQMYFSVSQEETTAKFHSRYACYAYYLSWVSEPYQILPAPKPSLITLIWIS